MNRLNLHLKVVLGIVLILNLSFYQPLFADPPPPNQNCAGDSLSQAEYENLMQVLDGMANIYANVFEQPFQYCSESPLLLEWNPVLGDSVSGFRFLPDGGTESFVFSVTRLSALTIDDYLHAVSLNPEVQSIDTQVVTNWRQHNITAGPVRGYLIGAIGTVELLGTLSAGLDEQGIMRAMLIPSHLLAANPPAMIPPPPCMLAHGNNGTFGGGKGITNSTNPSIGSDELLTSDEENYIICATAANDRYQRDLESANLSFAGCQGGLMTTVLSGVYACLGLCSFFSVFCVAACTLGGIAAIAIITYACVRTHDNDSQNAEQDRKDRLAQCDALFPGV